MDRARTAALELQGQPADDALGRTDNEELVVDRLICRNLAEKVADGQEHLPLRGAEIHERKRLMDLHVESRIERRVIVRRRMRERVADAVEHEHARRRFRNLRKSLPA